MFGNWFKTSLLMAGIVALFGAIGALLGSALGMLLALVLGGAMNLWAYWFSDRTVLRLYNAHEVDENSAPALYRMVRDLAHRAQLPMPPAEAHPETAQMMIVNPLSAGGIASLFSTHPDTGERIDRLHALARAAGN